VSKDGKSSHRLLVVLRVTETNAGSLAPLLALRADANLSNAGAANLAKAESDSDSEAGGDGNDGNNDGGDGGGGGSDADEGGGAGGGAPAGPHKGGKKGRPDSPELHERLDSRWGGGMTLVRVVQAARAAPRGLAQPSGVGCPVAAWTVALRC
jgi:hypothetical protein